MDQNKKKSILFRDLLIRDKDRGREGERSSLEYGVGSSLKQNKDREHSS